MGYAFIILGKKRSIRLADTAEWHALGGWVYVMLSEKEVGIRRIPTYTLDYTADVSRNVLSVCLEIMCRDILFPTTNYFIKVM